MAAGGVRPLRDRLRDAVERHRHHDDHEAREERERRVRVEAARDDVAEALAADQPGDHDHREREEDRLVDGEEQHPPRERQPHLARASAARVEPIASAASTVFVGNAADPERGDPDRGRDRVDHRRDHGRARPDREEDHDRHQVGERRDDLHRVEHGRDRALEAVGEPGADAERHPDQRARGRPRRASARGSACSRARGRWPRRRTGRTWQRQRRAPSNTSVEPLSRRAGNNRSGGPMPCSVSCTRPSWPCTAPCCRPASVHGWRTPPPT